jgi:hypothetical protein
MSPRLRAILRLAIAVVIAAGLTAYATVAALTAVASGRIVRPGGHLLTAAASPPAFWSYVGLLALGGLVTGVFGAVCLLALGRERGGGAEVEVADATPAVEKDAA